MTPVTTPALSSNVALLPTVSNKLLSANWTGGVTPMTKAGASNVTLIPTVGRMKNAAGIISVKVTVLLMTDADSTEWSVILTKDNASTVSKILNAQARVLVLTTNVSRSIATTIACVSDFQLLFVTKSTMLVLNA